MNRPRSSLWQRNLKLLLLPLAACLVLAAGCDDEGGSEIDNNDDLVDAPGMDIPNIEQSELRLINPPPGEALRIFYNSDARVEVGFYGPMGQPIAGQNLSFDIIAATDNCHQDAEPCVSLAALSSTTDSDGVAGVSVRAGVKSADVTVQVTADGVEGVAAVNALVQVRSKEETDLVVHYEYGGAREFTAVKPVLFEGDAQTCADVITPPLRDPADLPTAFRQNPDAQRDASGNIEDSVFIALPNDKSFIAVGYAETEAGLVTVYGCSDESTVGTDGFTREMTVDLQEVPILVAGNYGLTSNFDLLSGLPRRMTMDQDRKVGDWVDFVVGIFEDPVGTLVELLVPLIEDVGGFDIPDGLIPVVEGVLADTLEEFAPSWFNNALVVGGDISEFLKNFQLEGDLVISVEPDENGIIPAGQVHRYDTVTFRWRLPCVQEGNPADMCNTRRSGLSLSQIGATGVAIEGEWEGAVVPCEGSTGECLVINMHGLTVPYGEILLAVVEGFVLPEVFGPQVDSLELFIDKVLLAFLVDWFVGDNPNSGIDPDGGCASVGAIIEDLSGLGSISNSIGEWACDQGRQLLIDMVRDLAADLTFDSGDNLTLGTTPVATCRLFDTDGNLEYDAIGDGDLEDSRCDWDMMFRFNATDDPTAMTGKFDAVRGQ